MPWRCGASRSGCPRPGVQDGLSAIGSRNLLWKDQERGVFVASVSVRGTGPGRVTQRWMGDRGLRAARGVISGYGSEAPSRRCQRASTRPIEIADWLSDGLIVRVGPFVPGGEALDTAEVGDVAVIRRSARRGTTVGA